MKNRLMVLLLGLFMSMACCTAFADARADYESYLAAYNAYRNAVNEKRPATEILQLLESYQQAKGTYETAINKPKTVEPIPDSNTAIANPEIQNDFEFGNAQVQNAQAPQARQLPVGLKRILDQLWSEKGKKNPDQAMKLLASYADSSSNEQFADLARYELAKAYELLKNDEASASKVLNQIGKRNPNSRLAVLAKERLKFLAAGDKYKQWKHALDSNYGVSQESYQKYRDTSWLAFPVKATRWVGYVSKLFKFNNTQSDFEKFQIWYEDMGAKFVPPVDITFDRFKVAYGTSSNTSEISLFYSNSQSWYARWKAMEDARQSIDIQYFIMTKDIFGYSMLGSLLRKAKDGLKIRLLLDARGTKDFTRKLLGQDLLQELTAYPNVEVKVFNPIHANLITLFRDPRSLIASNHDKIMVIDGEIAIIGGRNVSMDYYLEPEDHSKAYRDSDVIIRCPEIAQQLAYAFDEEFSKLKTYSITKDLWGNIDVMTAQLEAAYDVMFSCLLNERFVPANGADRKYIKAAQAFVEESAGFNNLKAYAGFDPFANAVEAPAKIIDKHSKGGPRDDITDQMIRYIDGCRQEIVLQNPYVVLTDRMFAALQRAGKRGVPIILHTNSPASTDSLATQAMFYADWKRIFKEIPNIRIFVYKSANKLHAKNWVFDRKIGVVGTYNLDFLSEQINSEVVVAIKSGEFARQLRNEIMSDVQISEEYKFSINNKGEVESIFGPDDLQGKNFWLLKVLSKFTIFRKVI